MYKLTSQNRFFIQKTDLKYIKFLNVLFIKPKPGT